MDTKTIIDAKPKHRFGVINKHTIIYKRAYTDNYYATENSYYLLNIVVYI